MNLVSEILPKLKEATKSKSKDAHVVRRGLLLVDGCKVFGRYLRNVDEVKGSRFSYHALISTTNITSMKQKLLLLLLTLLPLAAHADRNGTCGENLTWYFAEQTKTLTISGAGLISESPWSSFRDDIDNVIMEEGVTIQGFVVSRNEKL